MTARRLFRPAFAVAIVWLLAGSPESWALPQDSPSMHLLTKLRQRLADELKAQDAHDGLLKSAPQEFQPGRGMNCHVARMKEISRWRSLFDKAKLQRIFQMGQLRVAKPKLGLEPRFETQRRHDLPGDTVDLFWRYDRIIYGPVLFAELDDSFSRQFAWLNFQIAFCEACIKVLHGAFEREQKTARRIAKLMLEETVLRHRIAFLKSALAVVDFAKSQLK
jgi:hypothetical protein